jgi:hypothetical protein
MIAIRLAPLALMLAVVAPASAQTTTPFEDAAMALVKPCFDIKPATETAAAAIAACEKVIADVAALKAQTPVAGHDLNLYLVVNSMALSRIGHSFAYQDGNRRTARVCTKMEESWANVSQIEPSASPTYAAVIKDLRKSSISVLGKCRSENGAPPGATPLPAE